MGFCYPGRGKGGDAPPRPECAPRWRQDILAKMPEVRLTLLVGTYAQNAVLGPGRISDRVRNFRDWLPQFFPLPHPSWRSQLWIDQNPWFRSEVLPALRNAVRQALSTSRP
jgi:uracil-DNA glycosylase